MRFSVIGVALSGFDLIRRKPAAFAVWIPFCAAVFAAKTVLAIGVLAPVLAARHAHATAASLAGLIAAYGVVIVFDIVAYAVMTTPLYRMVLEPERVSPGYLRFGADEVNQGLLLSGGLILLDLAAATGALARPDVTLLGGVVTLALLYALTRLTLFGPQSFAAKRQNIAASWALSGTLGWRLYAVGAASLLLTVLIYVAAYGGVTAILGSNAGRMLFHPDTRSFAGYFAGPANVAVFLFALLLQALTTAIGFTPGAVLYRKVAAGDEA